MLKCEACGKSEPEVRVEELGDIGTLCNRCQADIMFKWVTHDPVIRFLCNKIFELRKELSHGIQRTDG